MDDGHQSQPPGAAGGEQGQNVEGGHGAQLVTEKHHPAGQLPVVFIRHREQLPTQGLDHQPSHEVFGLIFLRKYQEDGGFLCGKALGVYGAVEAQHLLQLRVQKGVQPGEDGGHNGGHRLLGGSEGGAGEPLGLVFLRQVVHEELELILAGQNAGGQQLLHQFEYGHDMTPLPQLPVDPFGRQILCQQQDYGGEHALRRVVKILILCKVLPIRVDDGLGQDFGVLLRLGPGGQVGGLLPAYVHVVVDQGEQVIAI